MKISESGLDLIKAFESCMRAIGGGRFKAYLDPVNVLTIGWGHTNHHPPQFGAEVVWTQKQCDDALVRDIAIFEDVIHRRVKVLLAQHQFDALVSFAYNVGEGNLAKSSLLRKVNARDFDGAAREFHNWTRAGGRVLPGLVRRRASESLMFQGIIDRNYDGKPDAPVARRLDPPPPPPPSPAPEAVTTTGAGAAVAVGIQQGWPPGLIVMLIAAAVAALVIYKIWKGRQ